VLVVVTGVSGSGKSSLAFDIVFEEGRKQYLQSIGMVGDVASEDAFDQIAGIGPTVAVGQAIVRQSNPRSVVGTRTKILTYLGLLYARGTDALLHLRHHRRRGRWPSLRGLWQRRDTAAGERVLLQLAQWDVPAVWWTRRRLRTAHERLVPDDRITLREVLRAVDAFSSFQYLLKGRLEPYIGLPEGAVTDMLYGVQIRGHHIYCVPERDLVVAIASRPGGRWRDRWPLLAEFVIPSVTA